MQHGPSIIIVVLSTQARSAVLNTVALPKRLSQRLRLSTALPRKAHAES
jgi:hypothetical protein